MGRFINRLLCSEENTLLQEAMQAVGTGSVVAPMFDGFLATKTLDPKTTLDMLNQLPATVACGITWDQKQHNTEIVADPNYTPHERKYAETDVQLTKKVCDRLA